MASAEDYNFKREDDGDGEDDDDQVDETSYKAVKDAVLFAIDVSESMLARHEPEDASKKKPRDSASSAALKCAYQLMQQRIISNPKDMTGILLFGTEQSKFQQDDKDDSSFQYPHCYLLSDLDIPSAQDVKRIRNLIEDQEVYSKLLVPSKEPVAMSNLLFCANQIFTTRAPNFASRRLFLVTDNDDPHAHNKDMKQSAIVRAKDLYDLGVTIELFPIAQPGASFDRAKFYDDIVYRPSSDPEAPAPVTSVAKTSSNDGISLLQSLITAVHSKAVPKRALFSNLSLEFSPDFKISVKGYIIFKRQTPARSCYVWLDGETPQIAIGNTARIAEDTTRAVEKTEIKKAFKFGGETILFSPEELTQLRTFGDPVIRIIGFKPISMLPIWANMKTATFIYPSEEDYVGSTRTFSALQQTLLKKDKMGLVWYIARRNAAPVIAALLPGPEEAHPETGEQIMPPGMWLVPLPFADDIRSNPEPLKHLVAPPYLTKKMHDVVKQLQLPKAIYDPSKYPNPALQWHYRILHAIALEEDLPDHPEDSTIPRYRQVHKRAGAYVEEWGHALEEEYHKQAKASSALPSTLAKRANSENAEPSKRIKREGADDDAAAAAAVVPDHRIKSLNDSGKLASLKVADLKEWLKAKGQKPKTKKDDLVSQVENYFQYGKA